MILFQNSSFEIRAGDICAVVVRKRIRSLQLRVCPPEGEVRISAPLILSEERIRLFVAQKADWIRHHQTRIRSTPPPVVLRWEEGEEHLVQGEPHRLRVIEGAHAPRVVRWENMLELYVPSGASPADRREILERWYRREMQGLVLPLLETWQARMGVRVSAWGIKKMKTRWGSCNTRARRVWFNLELAKRSLGCLEFIVVHELAHLLERRHNARFYTIMDQFLPAWRVYDQGLSPSKRKREG